MVLSQTTPPQSARQTISEEITGAARPNRAFTQINLEALTPLQRQRLDTAVMMLVNYLVSVASEP